jgi:hypothetical protein
MTLADRIAEFLPGRVSRVTIPLLIVSLVLLALFTPTAETDQTYDPRLSSLLAGPNGAKGLYDVARRLGWQTVQRKTGPLDSIGSGTVVAVLAPPIPLSERETSLLLQRVREGASLLTIIDSDGPLGDSLHVDVGPRFVALPVDPAKGLGCPSRESRSAFQFVGGQAALRPFSQTTRPPSGSRIFLTFNGAGAPTSRFAAVGFPLGKGRVVAISDPNALRNDFIRVCKWGLGVTAVEMLEYLSAGKRPADTRIVFDEFHQGFGPQPSISRAVSKMLFGTAPGAMLVQIIVASVFLLVAIAPRPIPPATSPRTRRRSQFEHVEALSSAYKQISATRLVTERLVRGLRRRTAGGRAGFANQRDTDAVFLRQIASSYPEVSADVAVISSALTHQRSPKELIAAVRAIETIERTVKR